MKKLLPLAAFILVVIFFSSCKKDELVPKVDENGLSKKITDLVSQDVLDEMKGLGMSINGGDNPPIIEATYLVKPFTLVASNRSGDTPGKLFADYQVTFSGQDNDNLTVMVDYENGPESGTGLGSFIVGDATSFSVFVEVNSTHNFGSTAKFIHVLSGSLGENGIENFYYANFMLDDNGDPNNVWIENGEGRVIFDEDGFSEKI